MQKKPGIARSIKKSILVFICAAFLTSSAGCADSAEMIIAGVAGFVGWSMLEASKKDDSKDDPKPVEKGYCENFADLSSCYEASPSPDNEYWQSCAQAHAFCCDYAFGGANLSDYQQSCAAVQTLEQSQPELIGACEACRDIEIPETRVIMP